MQAILAAAQPARSSPSVGAVAEPEVRGLRHGLRHNDVQRVGEVAFERQAEGFGPFAVARARSPSAPSRPRLESLSRVRPARPRLSRDLDAVCLAHPLEQHRDPVPALFVVRLQVGVRAEMMMREPSGHGLTVPLGSGSVALARRHHEHERERRADCRARARRAAPAAGPRRARPPAQCGQPRGRGAARPRPDPGDDQPLRPEGPRRSRKRRSASSSSPASRSAAAPANRRSTPSPAPSARTAPSSSRRSSPARPWTPRSTSRA